MHPQSLIPIMKSIFKFALLAALIVSGRLVKQPTKVDVAQAVEAKKSTSRASVTLVHQVLTSEPVKPAQEQEQPPQSGNGLVVEMF